MSFNDKLRERVSKQAKSFYVEAWDETFYATPLSCGEMSKLQKRHPNFLQSMDGEAMVDLLILKCLTKDGEKAMDLADKPLLLKESMSVISSVAAAILGSQLEEDAAKN